MKEFISSTRSSTLLNGMFIIVGNESIADINYELLKGHSWSKPALMEMKGKMRILQIIMQKTPSPFFWEEGQPFIVVILTGVILSRAIFASSTYVLQFSVRDSPEGFHCDIGREFLTEKHPHGLIEFPLQADNGVPDGASAHAWLQKFSRVSWYAWNMGVHIVTHYLFWSVGGSV